MIPPKKSGAPAVPPSGPRPAAPMAPHLRAAIQACRSVVPPRSVQPRMSVAPPPARPSPRASVLAPPLHRPPVAQPCCWPFSLCFGGGSGEDDERRPLRVSTSQRPWAGRDREATGLNGEFQLSGTQIRIRSSAAKSSEVEELVRDFLQTDRMTLYRGMSAYHPNFKTALKGTVQPLGTGKSGFDTGASAWTAWQWDFDTAVSIAVSVQGMDKKDRIEAVEGYDKTDDKFVVGVVLKLIAGPEDFFTFADIMPDPD
jgi:hypothetical protein